jgi:hypothetical protein
MSAFRQVLIILGCAIVVCGLAQATTLADTVGYWQFGEKNTGDMANVGDTILDLSGKGHNGAVVDSAISYIDGPVAGSHALQFVNTSSHNYITVPGSSDFSFSSFTVEAEIRTPVGDHGTSGIVSSEADASNQWWIRSWGKSGQETYLENLYYRPADYPNAGDPEYVVNERGPKDTINDGLWHHIAWTYDASAAGGTSTLYQDGVQVTQDTGLGLPSGLGSSTGDIHLAMFAGGYHGNIDIDFIKLSNTALTPSQFQSSVPDAVPEPSGLLLIGTGLLGLLAYAWRKRR